MDALQLFQATTMLASDYPTETVDAIFFHARSYGDDDGLFELAAELHGKQLAYTVVINGSNGERWGGTVPGKAWPGRDAWLHRLESLKLEHVGLTRQAFHTREENDAFIEFAMQGAWKSAIILTQPHQLLRAFLGAVRAMSLKRYWMRLYAVAPKTTSWRKLVRGSQGMDELERFDHIAQEFARIEQYQKEGTLATLGELTDYLRNRDRIG